MKTKTLIIVCLFLVIGLTQLSAQTNNGIDNRNISYYTTWSQMWIPHSCNGVEYGMFWMDCEVHVIAKMEGPRLRDWVWIIMRFEGTFTSEWGEEFKIMQIVTFSQQTQDADTFNTRIIGNRGTQIIVSGHRFRNPETNEIEFVFDKAICN